MQHIKEPMQDIVAELRITDARQLQPQLDEAERQAICEALARQRHGVLVVRHDASNFTVALSPEVPFGTTREQDRRGATAGTQDIWFGNWTLRAGIVDAVRGCDLDMGFCSSP